jgi:aspartate/methionine/tyrosine aminotransferase
MNFFSHRSDEPLVPNALSQALARATAQSKRILDLTESNPTHAGIAYDEASILSALALPSGGAPALSYEPQPFGLWSARLAVARHLSEGGPPVDAGRIVLTASTSEAYAFLFKLLTDPGDEVLVPRPSYPLLDHLARIESVRCVPYRLAYDGAWHLDVASVRAAVSARTRALVVVQPNNPTGSHLTIAELDALAALDLPIVSDEVFSNYALADATPVPSALSASAPLIFSLGGLSKLAGLPQVKLAWMAVGGAPAQVAAALGRLELIADTFLSVGTPVQLAAGALLAARGTAEQSIRTRTRTNLSIARRNVAGSAVSVLDVKAGWYATLRLPRTRPEEAWAIGLVEDAGVYAHPGHFFDFEDEAYLVVSLLTPESIFEEGMRRVVAYVARG